MLENISLWLFSCSFFEITSCLHACTTEMAGNRVPNGGTSKPRLCNMHRNVNLYYDMLTIDVTSSAWA